MPRPEITELELIRWSEALAGIARTGLGFTESLYERERYEEVLKVAVGAVVGNDAGELLLIQRGDSGVWLYPTGWADIGYSPAEVAVKEVEEETGILAEPIRVIGILDGQRFGSRGMPFYSLVFHLRAVGGELDPHPLEARAVGWFAEDALPEPLAGGDRWKAMAFAALRGEDLPVFYDQPRPETWRGGRPAG
jgi:ADP-ribose pyrophosphatase YjhB (NUDIX family)